MRLTRQRKLILEQLRQTRSHPTAVEIYDKVRKLMPNISLGTVYRNLDVLCKTGVIQNIETCGGQKRFDGTLESHLHIICSGCGKIQDIECELDIDIDKLTDIDSDFQVTGFRFEILGICPECEARTDQGINISKQSNRRKT
ncbi:MAG: transcriptional repressor [Desulfonatronovibrio sp.]